MAKKPNVKACATEKEQATVSKKERAEAIRINVMSFIKTPKNFPPQCNTLIRECFLIVDVDTSKSDQWSSTSQKWPTTIIERVKTRESAESKARRKQLPEGHVAIALSTEEYNMLDAKHFNRNQRLSEVVTPKTREKKIEEESRLARRFTDLPVEPQVKKRMTRQEEEAVFARVTGLETQLQKIGTHAKGQSVYTPSKKYIRQAYESRDIEIPAKLLTRAEKASRRQEYQLKGKEIPMELLTRSERAERLQALKLSKQSEERFHGTCTRKCFVIVIRDQNSGMVALYKPSYLHNPMTYETKKEAEKDREKLIEDIGVKKCNTVITTIDDFKQHYDPSDVVDMEDLFGVCKIKLA